MTPRARSFLLPLTLAALHAPALKADYKLVIPHFRMVRRHH